MFTKIKISPKGKNYKFTSNIDISLFQNFFKTSKKKNVEKLFNIRSGNILQRLVKTT